MGCHGGFSIDEATRRSWFNPEKILADIGLRSGMVFIDIGSGDGFFTMLAARLVGENGLVYAVDTDGSAIERLKRKATQDRLNNVKAVVSEAEDSILCEGCADIIFYSIALHDFHNPLKVLHNAKQMLKSSGTLVDLDWKKEHMSFGPPEQIRFSEDTASKLMVTAGFEIMNVSDAGSYHYVITAKPSELTI